MAINTCIGKWNKFWIYQNYLGILIFSLGQVWLNLWICNLLEKFKKNCHYASCFSIILNWLNWASKIHVYFTTKPDFQHFSTTKLIDLGFKRLGFNQLNWIFLATLYYQWWNKCIGILVYKKLVTNVFKNFGTWCSDWELSKVNCCRTGTVHFLP